MSIDRYGAGVECGLGCLLSVVRVTRVGLPAALLAVFAAAQGTTVPARFAAGEAPSMGEVAGLAAPLRQQILFGRGVLGPLKGRKVTEVWFRRDSGYRKALAGGQATLELILSDGARSPVAASEDFAANHGPKAVVAFRGVVTIPGSPALPVGRVADWSPANTVRVVLLTPFSYRSGALCLEIRGRPVAGRETTWWPVDADHDATKGRADVLGRSCAAFARVRGRTAFAAEGSLRVGATARLTAFGQGGTPALLLLGARSPAGGVDLSPLGAQGCRMWVHPEASLRDVFHALPKSPLGMAHVTFPIPTDARLQGGRFFAQWVDLEWRLPRSRWSNPAGFSTSNGLRLTLASSPPRADVVVVTSSLVGTGAPWPARGRVATSRIPVVRFVAR